MANRPTPAPTPILRRLGDQMRAYRKAHRLSQLQIAGRANMAQSRYCWLENGRYEPRLSTLQRLADAMDADLEVTFTPRRRAE